jgi:hypothetical protein
MSELNEAIELNNKGAIYVAKAPRVDRGDDSSDVPTDKHDDDTVSLELVTVVGENGSNRLQQLCSKKMIPVWLLGLILVLLAIVLPLTLKGGPDNNVSEGPGSGIDFISDESSTTIAYQILEPVVTNPDNLLDPSTSEGKAYKVVKEEDDPAHIKQEYALHVLYFSTHGESWIYNNGYTSSEYKQPLCSRAGVSICRRADGSGAQVVAGLDLDSNNLKGTIPEDICLLTSLEEFRVPNNQLEGNLPACMASLPSLAILEADGNPDLSVGAVNDVAFCENGRPWESFVTDCVVTCNCCTYCAP